jgi:general transcription factor 3C polypeptide 5 (transcription factor C subunit 1)
LFEGGKTPDTFEVSLRPDDVMAKTILSRKADVRQLVLKVTVPKRTGRKRKLGSDGPFLPDRGLQSGSRNTNTKSESEPTEAETVLQALRDNKGRSTVQLVGKIDATHRFRSMPDFQYSTSTNTLMQNLRDSIMTTDLQKIRDFKYDMSRALADGQDVGPPPFFTIVRQPFNYSYRQNPHTKVLRDAEGNLQVTNTSAPIKHIRHNIDPDASTVPTGPPAELPPLETMAPRIQEAVKQLRAIFEKRPLMQRRVFVNLFQGKQNENELKVAVGYCGYAFTSGPWRDTVIKFGVDPRKDPQYRIYQTVSYQLQGEGKGATDDPGNYIRKVGGKRITAKKEKLEHSHIFDGTKFYKNGKVWQACDVTDPMLSSMLEKAELRSEPDVSPLRLPSERMLTNTDGVFGLVR